MLPMQLNNYEVLSLFLLKRTRHSKYFVNKCFFLVLLLFFCLLPRHLMEHWKEVPLNKNNEVELSAVDNISLHHGTLMICEGGALALTANSIHFKPAGAKIKWSMDLKSIHDLRREPSGYLSSGKIHFQVYSAVVGAKSNVWECQVCEEINESKGEIGSHKCKICGSVQKGKLLEVNIDANSSILKSPAFVAAWDCEVCEEKNDGKSSRCFSCGFSRPAAVASVKQEICETPKSFVAPVAGPQYKMSFKSGGSTVFFNKLQKAHEDALLRNKPAEETLTIGISGLLRRQEERNQAAEASLSTAFSDLDALMRSAGEMVALAAMISEKMNGELSAGDRNTFNDLVESLGITAGDDEHVTVTPDSSSFYDSIARSVSTLVQTMIEKTGTRVYSLADVFCIYNRTRTTGSLIAPADLLKGARQLSKLSLPVRLHKFTQKGMLCLVPAQDVDPHHLYSLIHRILAEKGTFLTAVDLADRMKVSLLLAGQQLQMAEMAGKVVRDGKRKDLPAFYVNNIINT